MATFLSGLGRFALRRRRRVAMLWIALPAVVGIGSASVSGTTSDRFTIPGTQSQKASDLLDKEFPQALPGRRAWALPHADVEGEKLRHIPDGPTTTAGPNREEGEENDQDGWLEPAHGHGS